MLSFLLTHLLRGVTQCFNPLFFYDFQFLLTHLLRGVTLNSFSSSSGLSFLLTHLLRGVTRTLRLYRTEISISTHTPLARCDRERYTGNLQIIRFLLTHLLRGVTDWTRTSDLLVIFLLTHLLRGVTYRGYWTSDVGAISTHTPLARCDGKAP